MYCAPYRTNWPIISTVLVCLCMDTGWWNFWSHRRRFQVSWYHAFSRLFSPFVSVFVLSRVEKPSTGGGKMCFDTLFYFKNCLPHRTCTDNLRQYGGITYQRRHLLLIVILLSITESLQSPPPHAPPSSKSATSGLFNLSWCWPNICSRDWFHPLIPTIYIGISYWQSQGVHC